jgi:hypothetical protein
MLQQLTKQNEEALQFQKEVRDELRASRPQNPKWYQQIGTLLYNASSHPLFAAPVGTFATIYLFLRYKGYSHEDAMTIL